MLEKGKGRGKDENTCRDITCLTN